MDGKDGVDDSGAWRESSAVSRPNKDFSTFNL